MAWYEIYVFLKPNNISHVQNKFQFVGMPGYLWHCGTFSHSLKSILLFSLPHYSLGETIYCVIVTLSNSLFLMLFQHMHFSPFASDSSDSRSIANASTFSSPLSIFSFFA